MSHPTPLITENADGPPATISSSGRMPANMLASSEHEHERDEARQRMFEHTSTVESTPNSNHLGPAPSHPLPPPPASPSSVALRTAPVIEDAMTWFRGERRCSPTCPPGSGTRTP